MKLNSKTKFAFISICFIFSVVGFMIRLPSNFSHLDKELHALFYFLAAAFLNLIFWNTNIAKHILIFIALFLFGITIEYAQEYSNKLFHKKIHGRFDIEDVHANLKGLVMFSIVWILHMSILFAYNKLKHRNRAR